MDRIELNDAVNRITQNLLLGYLFGLECARSGVTTDTLHAAMTSDLEGVLADYGQAGSELEALCISRIDAVFRFAKATEQRSLQGRSDD